MLSKAFISNSIIPSFTTHPPQHSHENLIFATSILCICCFLIGQHSAPWTFAPTQEKFYSMRDGFWASISSMLCQWLAPWCIGGDLNVTRFPHEKGGRRITHYMEKFSEFINNNKLVDMPMLGKKIHMV